MGARTWVWRRGCSVWPSSGSSSIHLPTAGNYMHPRQAFSTQAPVTSEPIVLCDGGCARVLGCGAGCLGARSTSKLWQTANISDGTKHPLDTEPSLAGNL